MLGVSAVVAAIATTLIAALLHIISYGHHRKQAIRFWERELKLPDATRYDNLQLRLEESQAKLDRYQDQLFDARQVIEEAERQKRWLEETREEVANLEHDRNELLRIQTELETLQTQLAELTQLRVQLESSISELQGKQQEYEKASAELDSTLKLLEEKKADTHEAMATLKNLAEEQKREEEKLEKIRNKAEGIRQQLQAELTDLKKQGDESRSLLENLLSEKESLEQKVVDLKADQSRLENLCSELEAEVEDLEQVRQEVSDAKEELLRLNDECDEEQRHLDKLIEQTDECRQKLDQLEAQRERLASDASRLDSKIDELEKVDNSLRKSVARLEAKSNALNSQMPILQSAFDSLSEKINPGSAGSDDARESDIWIPVLTGPKTLSDQSISETGALSNLRKHLELESLKFHERTINAFHTALKTTDSSPLVVLAGVSGTGKSELPRRYAEAMGFNFLNMAVQPRWDSPQDLFGFYDYLERKFRPTELTRALIQMDGLRNEGERGWRPPKDFFESSRSDGLLLVLLDEMNLARVEYYFSEFLSRLETRRGVDIYNDNERKRAEIVLEVSGRQSGDPPMQLFVDSNVIFVGTMNEDETTQSLSDKVIDRANVLRFGSPNSIASVYSNAVRNGEVASTEWRLSKERWFDWQRGSEDLDSNDRDRMLGWIAELRTALDGVRRPFAYRVAKSMLEYAANYPEVENRMEMVIADQIEQKVLPRLRGLDPHDPDAQAVFKTIREILTDTGDDVLIEAIKACSRDHYFQWGGLDRYEEAVVR